MIDQCVTGERWIGAVGRATTFRAPLGGVAGCRACPTLAEAELSCTSPEMFGDDLPAWQRLSGAVRRTSFGGDCYAYGLVALGQIDIVAESGLKVWDWAALAPVIEGAGGRLTDWNGEKSCARTAMASAGCRRCGTADAGRAPARWPGLSIAALRTPSGTDGREKKRGSIALALGLFAAAAGAARRRRPGLSLLGPPALAPDFDPFSLGQPGRAEGRRGGAQHDRHVRQLQSLHRPRPARRRGGPGVRLAADAQRRRSRKPNTAASPAPSRSPPTA